MSRRSALPAGISILCAAVLLPSVLAAPPPPTVPPPPAATQGKELGLILKEEGVTDGYTLLATEGHHATYLIDNDGYVVHEWTHDKLTAKVAYLLPSGNLLHTVASLEDDVGDMVEELTWDGEVVWQYATDRETRKIHHDVERLPNGNTLITVWEKITKEEYLAKGKNPELIPADVMWVDAIHEVRPTGKASGEVVWRWSAWDHLIQNFSTNAPNFGSPSEHPTRIDINQERSVDKPFADWLHINSVAYSADRNEVMLSVHSLSEIWVISRETDQLVYRWGDPLRYGTGTEADRTLFNQHDPHWIAAGLPGAGNILIFNNLAGIPEQKQYSSVVEIKPPLDDTGAWPPAGETGFPSPAIVWELTKASGERFHSVGLSNAQRLKSGNTLVTVGVFGTILEVNPQGEVVWKYINPIWGMGPQMKKLEKWNPGAPPRGPNVLFRAYKYAPDYPAFAGKDLSRKQMLKDNR